MTFTALDLASVAFWYDGGDLTQLYQDAAGTTPATGSNGQILGRLNDKGPNGYYATATAGPSWSTAGINGVGCLAFNGSQFLQSAASFLGSGWNTACSIYAVSAGGDTTNRLVWSDGGNAVWMERNGVPAQNQRHFHTPLTGGQTGAPYTTAATIDGFAYNGTNVRDVWVTSASMGRLAADSIAPSGPPYYGRVNARTGNLGMTGGLSIGQLTGSTGYNWLGQIGEIVGFNRVLDQYEERDLLEYLAAKWKIAAQPYLLCIGDSLSTNAYCGVGNDWPTQMSTLLGAGWLIDIDAYPGRYMWQAWPESYGSVGFRSWPRASNQQQFGFVWFGANDLQGLSVAQAQALFPTYVNLCQHYAQMGYAPVACTVLPRATITETTRQAWNALVRGNWQTFAVGLADFGGSPTIGAAGANMNPGPGPALYGSDNVHLNAAGNAIAAPIALGAIPRQLTVPLGAYSSLWQPAIGLGFGVS